MVKEKLTSLKSVRRALKQLHFEVDTLQEDIAEKQAIVTHKLDMIDTLEQRKAQLENEELIISDHAMIRYIQRVIGILEEDIKNRIFTDKLKAMFIGDGKYKLDGVEYVIKNNVIITIV